MNKEKIKDWFKDRDNLILVGIFIFAIIIRLYYFFLTKNQPLWWDEAEYMLKAKNIALGTPETGWAAQLRPIALPFLASIFFKIGLGEISIRFFLILFSIANIILVYLIGKKLFNKKIGLVSSFLYSIFYLDLFYAFRILTENIQIFFVLLSALLFIEVYFEEKNMKKIYWILPLIFLGSLFRFTVGIFAFVLFFFLIFTKGINLLKTKEWYISGILGIITFLPYMVYSQIKFGNPLQAFLFVLVGTGGNQRAENPVSVLMEYIRYFPQYNNILFFFLFIFGFGTALFTFFIGINKIKNDKKVQKYLFLLLWIIIPFSFFGLYINHFEDRYIFMIFPATIVLTGFAIIDFSSRLKKYSRLAPFVFIFALLLVSTYTDIKKSDSLIKNKLETYSDFRDGGKWIKENFGREEVIFSSGVAQLTYYSEKAIFEFPKTEEEFLRNIPNDKINFIIISNWQPSYEWVYPFLEKNKQNLTIAKEYFFQRQPSTIIYQFKNIQP